ncbi:MAG: hypothetical protein ACKN9T_08825, partial [Candidatus Methylumidiphilus sp.]
MPNPFDLTDAVIRDLPHVRVERVAPESGGLCTYRKRFKADGIAAPDYWLGRENQFLLDFAADRLPHVQRLAELKFQDDGHKTPVVSLLATSDAGVTVEDWLKLRPRYGNGESYAHPFKQAALFLLLLRACLTALRTIHAEGIVHCDVKADNICLPYSPYPYQPGPGRLLRIDFEHVRLIDFAFSVTPKRPLQHPLPIQPTAPYQSNLLKNSLRHDHARASGKALQVQTLDWRADLFSLGHMAGLIAEAGLVAPPGPGGRAAHDAAHRFVERLKAYDNGKRPPKQRPHDALIAEIDGLLRNLGDFEVYRQFAVLDAADGAADAKAFGSGIVPTPTTPVATPAADAADEWRTAPKTPPVKLKKRGRVAAALVGIGIAVGVASWPEMPPTPRTTATAVALTPQPVKQQERPKPAPPKP